jgi:phosphopantothenoylcysteine decarboxylase/phosphopantothenate--cysteine ligase
MVEFTPTAPSSLDGKFIVLCVTGSIAAVETIRLCHALRRRGAVVQAVMSQAACNIIHPDALTYATGRDVITRISGHVEHVTLCGDSGLADLVLIAPATANTISKIACGIDDTPVTTCITTALGNSREKMPIILIPAMHEAMFLHQAITSNLETLEKWGITVIKPHIEEKKAKIADNDTIVLTCERACSQRALSGTSVLITGGRCEEPVDDIRILTTRSSGTMGIELARAAYRAGADVTLVQNYHIPALPDIPHLSTLQTSTAASMSTTVLDIIKKQKPDIYISAAAISDFAPDPFPGKISSCTSEVPLTLYPLPKLLPQVMHTGVKTIVAFKLGGTSLEDARAMLSEHPQICMVVANTLENMGGATGSIHILSRSNPLFNSSSTFTTITNTDANLDLKAPSGTLTTTEVTGSKETLAHAIISKLEQILT